ncbi:MAG TPA: site-2 protease family protein [Planctomycetota bacterium]|nr:site-2 protease family protein [Planctomycetota bacterium]
MGKFDLMEMLLRVPPLLLALTVHEFAHAWMAWRCGDPTAKNLGRLTFNPLVHLDPIGALCLLFGPFGWAKPVPVNPYNFRNPRRDDILVSLAGVAANLLTAIALALLIRLAGHLGFNPLTSRVVWTLWLMVHVLLLMSLGLFLFNLIPVPPLDGSHVLRNLLPRDMAIAYERAAPIASVIFLILIVSGGMNPILGPPHAFLVHLLLGT